MGRLFISALHKSSGKTMISVGLAAAFRARGLAVQTFRRGLTTSIRCGWRMRKRTRLLQSRLQYAGAAKEIVASVARETRRAPMSP